MTPPRLQAQGLAFSYTPDSPPVLKALDLDLEPGSFVGLLGPNGSGKSTLLKLLAGVLRPVQGCVQLGGEDVSRIPRGRLASTLAFVPQDVHVWLPFTCREVVAMGRYVHRSGLGLLDSGHDEVVHRCMADTGVVDLADRRITEVSGGEAQRVRIAQALAQEAGILVLDEPTSHLDISFQVEVMDLLARLNRTRGLTILAALHDLNLASLYCDRLIALRRGHVLRDGPPVEVLEPALLREVFGVQVEVQKEPGRRPRLFLVPAENREA